MREEHVRDCAELARIGGVSRARVSQIMGLLNLALDIQECLLFSGPPSEHNSATERNVRRVATECDWEEQHRAFERLVV